MTEEKARRPSVLEEFLRDFPGVWRSIPNKGLFTTCLVLWTLLFEFLGNSTFGYIKTHSLFAWADYSYVSGADDQHGLIIPFLVLGLLWWKRQDLASIRPRPWLPGLLLIAVSLILHLLGFLSQQARLSLAGFFFGLYGLIGMVWGPGALRKTFFPMCLLAFALPLGTLAETITFPLRLIATKLTTGFSATVLGISVIRQGTLIFDPSGAFSYEVAAACGGLRSLTAVLALCTIYAFMNFKKARNILLMIAAGFPLAVLGNVTRLVLIIIVSEAFGQKWGNWVHDNAFFSLLPYLPPIVGILLLGHLLGEEQKAKTPIEPPIVDQRGRLPAAT
jgi:exosortase